MNIEQTSAPVAEPFHDPEGEMAKADLYRAAKQSIKLFQMIEDNQDLEAWVQVKIAKAAEAIDQIYHYLEYQTKFGGTGSHQVGSIDELTNDAEKEPEFDEFGGDELLGMKESRYENRLKQLLESSIKKEKLAKKEEIISGDKKKKPAQKPKTPVKSAPVKKETPKTPLKVQPKKKGVKAIDESQLDELSKDTLTSYVGKKQDQLSSPERAKEPNKQKYVKDTVKGYQNLGKAKKRIAAADKKEPLTFNKKTEPKTSTYDQDRGYGQGRYMGDSKEVVKTPITESVELSRIKLLSGL